MYLHGDNSTINLSYIAHGFQLHPAVSFAGFSALVGVASWHFTWGWAKWLGWIPSQLTENSVETHIGKKRRWYTLNGISAVVASIWLAGGLGIVGRGGRASGWVAKEFDDLYNHIPLLWRL